MIWHITSVVSLIFAFLAKAETVRILAIASVPTFSHNVFFRPLWKALADRGYQLTVLTTDSMENSYPNIREIDLHYVYKRKNDLFNISWSPRDWPKLIETYQNMFTDVALMELNHPEVQVLLRNESEHFDLVIAEMHIPLMFGFSHRFKCPLIGISSTEIITTQHRLLGHPTHPILYPESLIPTNQGRSFRERLLSIYTTILGSIKFPNREKVNNDFLKHYFGPETPTYGDFMEKMSWVLLNTHRMFNSRPLSLKCVPIGGGMHIEKPKPLPLHLQELLDQSTQGVVYFSLGTNVRPQQYPPNFLNKTLEAFKELPYQIIWKTNEISNQFHLPPNVKTFPWVPQQDLLRHPNIKVFITQGGLHSVEEAVHAGVPMIGIPFMSDQWRNVAIMLEKGFGIYLNKQNMEKETLHLAILEVIFNEQYKNTVLGMSRLLKDEPISGLEKALNHVEYTLKTRDIQHLLSNGPKKSVPWYQYYFLDVITVTLGLLTLICKILKLVFKILYVFTNGIKNKVKIS
ncbi:hypothetical protein ABEB36_000567 [Hypothenemus hampei]|uniref:UDP-glucuronosyltransferase n=1 Tax=Hypothenemus hampei TaxID=57062 RepID=A0ABD1FBP3_HYPHA